MKTAETKQILKNQVLIMRSLLHLSKHHEIMDGLNENIVKTKEIINKMDNRT